MGKPAAIPMQEDGEAAPADEQGVLEPLIAALLDIRAQIMAYETEAEDDLRQAHPSYAASARNLVHYLALRRHDLRPLQEQLAALGLSSLGRSEAHVLQTLDAVLTALHRLAGRQWRPPDAAPPVGFDAGRALLHEHTEALLGAAPEGRTVRIMVTLPSEAAADPELGSALLEQGADLVRINCAHDGAEAWLGMIRNVRAAEARLGRRCAILMDLAGPKLRTGPIAPGPEVVSWRPKRDAFGVVAAPARIWLTPEERPAPAPSRAAAALPAAGAWLAALQPGERIQFRDVRGKKRRLTVVEAVGDSRWAEAVESAHVAPGTMLVRVARGRARREGERSAPVGALPAQERAIPLSVGDTLILTRAQTPGLSAVVNAEGAVVQPAHLPCTLPQVFADVRLGQRIALDDGKIVGVITGVSHEELRLRVTLVGGGIARLRADKGINLPDTALRLPSLTGDDLNDLSFVVEHADIVGLSFAQDPAGVEALQAALAQRQDRPPGMLLKIETQRGFAQLPRLLLTAMRTAPVGVMIARGDLAVECGYDRLAEVQEEMLWLCEAAHVPVVWATQVLESLAKTGLPSRAEITDAAMGERAECVMLNKGAHMVQAVAALDSILRRMQDHQQKKTAMLRKLHISGGG